MSLACPSCNSTTIKKMDIFITESKIIDVFHVASNLFSTLKKIIPEEERAKIRQALLERVSLEGICRIFNVSMPWLLKFMDEIIHGFPEKLNAHVVGNEELEIDILELDEQWSYVGKRKIRDGYGLLLTVQPGKS